MMQNLREFFASNILFILAQDYFIINAAEHLWAFSLFFSFSSTLVMKILFLKNKLPQENATKRKWCVLLMCLDSPVYFNEDSKSTANVDLHRHINEKSILGYAQSY